MSEMLLAWPGLLCVRTPATPLPRSGVGSLPHPLPVREVFASGKVTTLRSLRKNERSTTVWNRPWLEYFGKPTRHQPACLTSCCPQRTASANTPSLPRLRPRQGSLKVLHGTSDTVTSPPEPGAMVLFETPRGICDRCVEPCCDTAHRLATLNDHSTTHEPHSMTHDGAQHPAVSAHIMRPGCRQTCRQRLHWGLPAVLHHASRLAARHSLLLDATTKRDNSTLSAHLHRQFPPWSRCRLQVRCTSQLEPTTWSPPG